MERRLERAVEQVEKVRGCLVIYGGLHGSGTLHV